MLLCTFAITTVGYASDGPATSDELEKIEVIDLESTADIDSTILKIEYGMHAVFTFEIESFIYPRTITDIVAFFGNLMKDYAHRHS